MVRVGRGQAEPAGRHRSYTRHDIDTTRLAKVAGASQRLTAGSRASTTQLFTELGYAMALSERASIEPFVGLA
jgi:fibronectin-binding autotransporter adhesin